MKKAFKIPNITQALAEEVRSGEITIEEAAKELYLANLLPYIDLTRAKMMLDRED